MTDEDRNNIYSRMTLKSRVMNKARQAFCKACQRGGGCGQKCDRFLEYDRQLYQQTKDIR